MAWGASSDLLISDSHPNGRQMEHFLSAVTNEWTKTREEDVSQPRLWTQAELKAAGTIIRWRRTIRRGWQERRAWLHFLKLALRREQRDALPFLVGGALGWSLHASRDYWWTSTYDNDIRVVLAPCHHWWGFKQPYWQIHTQQRWIVHICRCSKWTNCQPWPFFRLGLCARFPQFSPTNIEKTACLALCLQPASVLTSCWNGPFRGTDHFLGSRQEQFASEVGPTPCCRCCDWPGNCIGEVVTSQRDSNSVFELTVIK